MDINNQMYGRKLTLLRHMKQAIIELVIVFGSLKFYPSFFGLVRRVPSAGGVCVVHGLVILLRDPTEINT